MNRDELTAEIEANWRQLDGVVARLTPDDLKRTLTSRDPEDPTWTIADAILHIAAWKRNGTRVAEMQAEPGSQPVDAYPPQILGIDLQEFNDALVQDSSRSRELADVLLEHRAAHEAIMGAIEALPDDRLLLDERPRLWLAPVTWHPNSHLNKDILATLE
ncbi:MAG TPA: maleylpyruvate isomerase N-terminal domain-containing protein [Candidatus Solibacter sp.]|nr:maleylpyruvate isomerase N-terminal domain-containing protein [Candidatus Solibacter sp.]